MRYTTIIDIREQRAVYRNHNCRLLYLHLCLDAGYHDNDRDIVTSSIRTIAAEVGLTVSAVRHALQMLETYGLVVRNGNIWTVKKWELEKTITPRARTKREQKEKENATRRRNEQEKREREMEQYREEEARRRAEGKTGFMIFYEDLLKRAAQGDPDAQRGVIRHKEAYERQLAEMEIRKKKD